MNTNVPIVPDEITTKQTAVSFIVTCRSLELFTTASFLVNLMDINRSIINSQFITLTTDATIIGTDDTSISVRLPDCSYNIFGSDNILDFLF